jgi:hypothetical protein
MFPGGMMGHYYYYYYYTTRLAPKEIFSLSNRIHREVGRAKDLSAPRYVLYTVQYITLTSPYYPGTIFKKLCTCTPCYGMEVPGI